MTSPGNRNFSSIIIFLGQLCACGPSLTETTFHGAWLKVFLTSWEFLFCIGCIFLDWSHPRISGAFGVGCSCWKALLPWLRQAQAIPGTDSDSFSWVACYFCFNRASSPSSFLGLLLCFPIAMWPPQPLFPSWISWPSHSHLLVHTLEWNLWLSLFMPCYALGSDVPPGLRGREWKISNSRAK